MFKFNFFSKTSKQGRSLRFGMLNVIVGGRRLSVEDNLWWKTTFGGRRPLVEDDLRWKTTFGGRQPLVEDTLWWKTTYSRRRPSVEDNFWGKTILACCLVRFAAFF